MKLSSHIARYLRRCGYAIAITLATGATLHAATQETVIEFLTHEGGMPADVVEQTKYVFDMNLAMPAIPEGTTEWDTAAIVDRVESEEGTIRGWCPWRTKKNNDYEIFNYTQPNAHYTDEVTQNSITWVRNAIRPALQGTVPGEPALPLVTIEKLTPYRVGEISYVGARSVLPSQDDARNDFTYYSKNDIYQQTVYVKSDSGYTQIRPTLNPLYDIDGNPICDQNGEQLYTARNSVQYYSHAITYSEADVQNGLYDAEGNLQTAESRQIEVDGETRYIVGDGNTTYYGWDADNNTKIDLTTADAYEALNAWTDASFYAGWSGDDNNASRGIIQATTQKAEISNNLLVIERSGFSLAVGAYAEWGDVTNNVTYIQDVRVSDDIIAAATYRGECTNNTLIVVRAQAIGLNTTLEDEQAGVTSSDYNSGGKLYAALSPYCENDSHCTYNTAFIYGVSSYLEASGALAAGNADNNLLFVSHSDLGLTTDPSDISAVSGGYSLRAGTATGNTVIIDDTYDAIAAGVAEEVRDDSVIGGWTSSVPELSTIHADIIGGGSEAARATTNANNNRVILIGASSADGLTRTSVEGNIFGGVAYNSWYEEATQAASANGNTVVLNGIDVKNSVNVPILRGRAPEDNVWGVKTISTDVGRVCGGYAAAPTSTNTSAGNANNNTVILQDSKIPNSVYGGSNAGNGQADSNELHLSHVDTTGSDGITYQNRTFYGGWIDSYEDGGQTNNNNVWLYDTDWSMDNTFLHGGDGNELVKDADSVILGTDGTPLIAGATDFDGSAFYDANGKKLASLQLSKVVKNNANQTTSDIFSSVTAFDGENFYNNSRNNTGTFESLSIANTGNVDIIPAAVDIKVNEDNSVDFITDDDNNSVIATYYAMGENAGNIVGTDGIILASGIYQYNPETESFEDALGKVLYRVARGTIVNSSKKIMAEGITTYEFDEASGNLLFKDSDGNTVATFLSSTITGTDANNDAVNLVIPDSEVDKNGIHMVKRGNISSIFAKLTGLDAYETYTRGNWLHIAGYQGRIKGFDHFEKLRFYFTDEIDLTQPMLVITGDADETALSYTTLNEEGNEEETPITLTADISAIADELMPGDIVPVIAHEDSAEGTTLSGLEDIPRESVVDDEQTYRQGVTRTMTLDTEFFAVNNEDDDTTNDADKEYENMGVIKVKSRTDEVTPESKSLIEGRIATLTLNNMGGNLVAEQGIDSACRALEGDAPADSNTFVPVAQDAKGSPIYAPKSELKPGNRLFFAMSGAHNKVDSGSDVDVDGTNALVGVSRGMLAQRALTLGAFMETGWGKYHTHNNFGEGANVPAVRGTGETSYVGAGALMRYHLRHLGRRLDGVSLDASLRAGRQETDYSTADLVDNYGTFASYEHESDYIAGHVGVNYTFEPADKLSATLDARYLWSHVSGEDAVVCGETVNFGDMSSNRFRFGGRLAWQATEKWTPYAGAAWEWECSGTARATTYGMGITAPSMRGGSIIGEIGTVWQPSLSRALWVEAALQGSAGKNENYGARLGVSIGF